MCPYSVLSVQSIIKIIEVLWIIPRKDLLNPEVLVNSPAIWTPKKASLDLVIEAKISR